VLEWLYIKKKYLFETLQYRKKGRFFFKKKKPCRIVTLPFVTKNTMIAPKMNPKAKAANANKPLNHNFLFDTGLSGISSSSIY